MSQRSYAAPSRDRDAHPRPVDLLDGGELRARGYQIGRLDQGVGGAERDLLRARRLGGDQADVPDPGPGGIGEFARARVRDIGDRHAQALGDFARHVGSDALGLARGAPAADQEEVAEVDAGAQHAGRGKLGEHVLGHGTGPG